MRRWVAGSGTSLYEIVISIFRGSELPKNPTLKNDCFEGSNNNGTLQTESIFRIVDCCVGSMQSHQSNLVRFMALIDRNGRDDIHHHKRACR